MGGDASPIGRPAGGPLARAAPCTRRKETHDVSHDAGQTGPRPGDEPPRGLSRRTLIREGVKLAFVAPVIATFFAREAQAGMNSNHSCYPVGHACGGVTLESCCDGLNCVANTCQ
jgi:hypothetical protein